MDPKIIKKTQDTLGKYIKKPPLTEKLLSKPPFRFLHDITTSVIKSTGFMKGLFTETEMNSENVKERDSKIAFLQKIIDMVSLVLGRTIAARPGKIVAGQEAEKTNELLQALAEAIGKKVNNAEYVQRVLKTSDTPASASKKEGDRRKKEKGERSKEEHDKSRERDRSKDRRKESSRDKDRDRDKHRDKSHDKEREKSRDKDRDRHHDKERSHDRRDRDKSRDKGRDKDEERHHKDRERRKRKEEKLEDHGAVNGGDVQQDMPPTIPRPSSAKGSRRRHGHAAGNSSDEEEEQIRQIEREKSSRRRETIKEDDLPPQVAPNRRMQRPGSARPAPPKVKKNEGQEDSVLLGSSNVPNLITDKDNSDDDEDEGFIAKDDDEPEPLISAPVKQDDDLDGDEHGGLVKKMLETKKELEGGSQQPDRKTEIERSQVNDVTRRRERELIQKEIDKLRASIQTLTRSVNPLGKILDFIQEDLDSMHKELMMWQAENRENSVALQREQSITENSIEPLKAQLKELEAATTDQLDLIAAVKNNILRNDEKIEKMLSTITRS